MVPRLTLNHLTVLSALAETRGVTATAARLGLTQSAVSHRLREAERRVGARLVRRVDGAMTLTPEGERVRALADRFLDELVRLEQELAADRDGARRLVRLGQATYSRYHWLPAFLEFTERSAPDLSVDLSARAASRPFAALVEGSVDVSTVYGRPSALPRFRWRKLATDPLIGVVAPGHRLAKAAHLDSRLIEDERYYTYPLSAEPGFEWEALIGAPSVPFRRITQMPTPEAVIDLVRAGFGVGIFSRWAVQPELSDGTLIEKPLGAEGMALDWWAVTRASDPPGGPADRLAEALVEWGRRDEVGLATLGFEGEAR
ncbi:MAG: LysR family transcriptional regulator [Marivibrio sp.]|uniref:LysR family transcriptional regulator n=1 Tax=Marivibrio sp. TaxID=2039719 RepID=UPI0032EAD039